MASSALRLRADNMAAAAPPLPAFFGSMGCHGMWGKSGENHGENP